MGNMVLWASAFAYIAAFTGLLVGGILSITTKKQGQRFRGCIMGFTGGLLIAFVCFELLPNAFESGMFYTSIVGMLCGVIATAYFENKVIDINKKYEVNGEMKSSLLLAMGIAVHNIPEGLAIGSLFAISRNEGINLCLIIALHCIPEGLAISMAINNSKSNAIKLILLMSVLAIPMGMGSFFGVMLSGISDVLMTLCFSFAGGVMLYITCGEIIPESKEIWSGRLTTIGALLGFILGIIVIYEI